MALFGSDTSAVPPTQTTMRLPSAEETRLRSLAMPGIEQFASQQLQQFPGQTYAGFDPLQTQAQETAVGTAAPAQQQLANTFAGGVNYLGGSQIWDPSINPQIQRTIDAAVRPVNEQLTQSTLPAIRSAAIGAGQFGGSRGGIAEGLAAQGAAREAGDIAARIPTDLYKTNIQAQLAALGLAPQAQQAQVAAPGTVGAVGDVRQNMSQLGINQAQSEFNFDQYANYMRARELMGLASGIPAAGTQSTGSVAPGPSDAQKAIGGAMAGASLGSMFGPVGMGVGAAGGAVMPFLFS